MIQLNMTARELANLSKDEFKQYVYKYFQHKNDTKQSKLAIRFPYALNCPISEKEADCSKRCKYTVFLNNAGTIAHVLSSENDGMLIRLTFKPSIKHLSTKRQAVILYNRLKNILVLSPEEV